ncbi:MAG: hypothetical protein RL199_518 [Pseudomonadota bacterium]|jgi:tetratricopeptide (TPR) repeat protein
MMRPRLSTSALVGLALLSAGAPAGAKAPKHGRPATAPVKAAPTPDEWRTRALDAAKAGQAAAAAEAWDELLALRPDDAQALMESGALRYRAGRFADAAARFQRLCAVAPDLPAAYFNLSWAQRKQGAYGAAETSLRRCLALVPDDADALYALAESLRAQGRHPDAAAAYDAFLAQEAAGGDQGDVDRARAKADQLRRGSGPALVTRLKATGAGATAVASAEASAPVARASAGRDPTAAALRVRDGDALFQQKRYAEALEAYQDALKLDDQSIAALLKSGLARANGGDVAGAEGDWNRVLALDPAHTFARGYLEKLAARRSASSAAAASPAATPVGSEATKAAAPVAGDPKELYRKGVGLMAEAKFEEAASVLTSALAQNPAFTNAYVARGGSYLGLKRFEEAAADYRHALTLDATLATPLFGLGRALDRLGDRAGSCENYRRYLASSGRDVQAKLLDQARQAYARCTEPVTGGAGAP